MAIVKMKKLTLAAPKSERDAVLDLLQNGGSVQLIDLKSVSTDLEGISFFKDSGELLEAEAEFNHIKFAYEFLRKYSSQKKKLFGKREVIAKHDFELISKRVDWQSIYNDCSFLDEAINLNRNQKSKAASLVEAYNDWINLDISEDDISGLEKVVQFMGSVSQNVKTSLFESLKSVSSDIYIELISEKKQDVNLFMLCHISDEQNVSDVLRKFGFVKADLKLSLPPADEVKEELRRIKELDSEYEVLLEKAGGLSKNICDLERAFDYIYCKVDKERAISNLIKTSKAFILEGWITEEDGPKLEDILEKRFDDIYVGFEDPKENESPPIVLKNNPLVEPFEMITSMYALPKPDEVDPTPILTPFYIVFFGMMMGDVGYGLLMLAISIFALKFLDIKDETKKLVKIILYCSIPTIIFGFLFGGFFGNAIPMKPLWVNPVDKPMDVLYVSMAMGIVHLFTGLGVKAYWLIKNGKVMDAVFDVFFWYALLSGLIWMLVSSMASLPGGNIAKYIAIAGAIGLLLTQGRSNASLAGKIFGGIYGLYGVTSYIGDVLSYSRLLALGLATSLIGTSFNLLIKLLGKGAFGYVFGVVIFICGHTFNFLIGMLGTFVHTCRLEYLEFFGKFYEGGGRPFTPLKLKTKFVKFNTEK